MRIFRVVTVFSIGLVFSGCADKAKADYARCVQLDISGDVGATWDACNAAIIADPNSESGKAAAAKLTALKPKYEAWKIDQAKKEAEEKAAQQLAQAKAAAAAAEEQKARELALEKAHAWRRAMLREKISRSSLSVDDGRCAGRGLPPHAYMYEGGLYSENAEAADLDGCKRYGGNEMEFCCP